MAYEDRRHGLRNAQESRGSAAATQRVIAPGKRTLTANLSRGTAGAPAPVQMKPRDPAAIAAREVQAARTQQWLDMAVRPDLFAAEAIHGQGNDGPQQEASLPPGNAAAAAPTMRAEQVTTVIPAGGAPATRTGGPGTTGSDSETTAFGIVAPGGAPAVVAGGGVNTCTASTARAALAWDVVVEGA